MKKTLLLTAAALTLTTPLFASPATAAEFNKAEITQMIEAYILDNGDKVMQGVENFQKKQQQESEKGASEKIKNGQSFLNDSKHPSIGPADADVTVVEFFDYNCGYCKKAFTDIQAIAKKDPKTRFVFLEMPILGPTSITASQWSLAAHEQGKYFEYHTALMNHKGPKNEKELTKLAKNLGLDIKKMKKDANSNKIKQSITESGNFSRAMGVRGTPAFIVGDELIRGYIGVSGMESKIADRRAKK